MRISDWSSDVCSSDLLRGRAPLELGINAGRALLHMPVDHDAPAAIAGVPFHHQDAVPRAVLRWIGSACRSRISPYCGIAECPLPVSYPPATSPPPWPLDQLAEDLAQLQCHCLAV